MEEQYLVVSIDGDEVCLTRVSAVTGTKRFEAVKSLQGVRADLPSMFTRIGIRYTTKIIISLSHRYATTLRRSLNIQRNDAKLPITEAELENVVSRVLWKLFNQERHAGAVKMKTVDISVKVFDPDIISVRLDGHRILDPLGFCADTIELVCQETLVVHPLIADLFELIPEEQVVSVQEEPAAWPLLVCANGSVKEFLALSVLASETVLYRYADETLQRIDSFSWGGRDIARGIGAFFGVGDEEARKIIDFYIKGNVSVSVSRKVEDALSQELSILFKGIESHRTEGDRGNIYIASQLKIPEALFNSKHLRRLHVNFTPILLNSDWISEKLGYGLKLAESVDFSCASADSVCAALAVYQAQRADTQLSKIAKRRARWL